VYKYYRKKILWLIRDAMKQKYKRFFTHLCGISSPPSTAPLRAPKTLAPVVVLARPTSRKQRKAPGEPSTLSTLYSSPLTS